MKELLKEIEALKRGKIRRIIDSRIKEFEKAGRGDDARLFSELCFCIMTANFQAEKSIKIQDALCQAFPALSQERLALELRKHGHRFPNARASYICEARKHHALLKKTLESFEDELALRDWLVANVKGLGLKESSHFLRNIGYKNYAIIDFHIVDLLARHRLIPVPAGKAVSRKRYLEVEKILGKIAASSGLTQAELDLYLWYMETGKVLK
jgi:N-glycosylase/DNA lyase